MYGEEVEPYLAGIEIMIKIWFSVQKTCIRILISPAISGFPVENPNLHMSIYLAISGFPVGFLSPFLGLPQTQNFKPCILSTQSKLNPIMSRKEFIKYSGTLECDHPDNLTTLQKRPLFGSPFLGFPYLNHLDKVTRTELGFMSLSE